MKQPEDLTDSSLIANCVLNAFLSCTAIVLNIITILALRKTSSLPKPLKTLLLSLAVSDLGVGLLVQPMFIVVLVMGQNSEQNSEKIVQDATTVTAVFLPHVSYFGVVALSADRFLAIHYYLRYQELVTHKRAVASVISVWVLSMVLVAVLWWIPAIVSAIILATVNAVCFVTTALFYFKIYLAVRHHSNQIHVLLAQQAQNDEVIVNTVRQRKAAVGTFYVYLVFLACFLPNLCMEVIYRTTGLNTVTWHLRIYTFTLLALNSSLNPLIYCWKMTDIRHAVMGILRNILPCYNWAKKVAVQREAKQRSTTAL